MFILREEHKKQLESGKVKAFTEEMVAYFYAKDPFHANAIGEDGVRAVVKLGIKKAAKYTFSRKSPVQLYIHLMFYLGSHFDVDPLMPWANEFLQAPNNQSSETTRMNALRGKALEYLEKTCGKEGEYLQAFMKGIKTQIEAQTEITSNDDIADFLYKNYPQKFNYVGKKLIADLVTDSKKQMENHGLIELRSVWVLTCLRLVYGASVTNDPLFPWVRDTLETDRLNKDELFWRVSVLFFDKVHKHIEGKT